MENQVFKIATQKNNNFILVFENITSQTSVLDRDKCQLVLLESPQRLVALIPKHTCAQGHRIQLYLNQNSQVSKTVTDIREDKETISLLSEVAEISEYNKELIYVTFNLLDEHKDKHSQLESVILERQEKINKLLNKFRSALPEEG